MQVQLHLIPGGEPSPQPDVETSDVETSDVETSDVEKSDVEKSGIEVTKPDEPTRRHEPWRRDDSWRLDATTCEIGRRGIAKAREALREARQERPEQWAHAV